MKGSDEQTDDPAYADERDFYKVEAWSRDDELMVMRDRASIEPIRYSKPR